MKKLKKINLVKLSKEELDRREQGKLLGGETCCICGYGIQNAIANNAGGLYSPGGGYGNGSFRG